MSTAMPLQPTFPDHSDVRVEIASVAELPSEFGNFRVYVFSNNRDSKEHLAMVHGEVFGAHDLARHGHSRLARHKRFGGIGNVCILLNELADLAAQFVELGFECDSGGAHDEVW